MTSVAPPICIGCRHLVGNLMEPHCSAFPEGVPWDVLLSKVDHRQPFPGDNGIQFEPKTSTDAKYAVMLFEDLTPAQSGPKMKPRK